MNLGKIIQVNSTYLIFSMLFILGSILLISQYSQAEIHLWSNHHHYPWLDAIMPWLTYLGDGWIYLILAIYSVLLLERRAFMSVLFTALLTLIFSSSLKAYFNEDRPMKYFADRGIELNEVAGVKPRYQHSFPSGHTTTAFAAWGILAFWWRKKHWQFLAFLVAVSIGYSRIYLNMHFLRDVGAGASLGTFVVLLSLYLAHRLKGDWFKEKWFK